MRTSIALVILTLAITPPPAWGHDAGPARRPEQSARLLPSANPLAGESGRLVDSGFREAVRLRSTNRRLLQEAPGDVQTRKNWISRHPVLFGAAVGAGAGTVTSALMENELFCSRGDEDCFFHGGSRVVVGAGFGAGIGALVGWLGSL